MKRGEALHFYLSLARELHMSLGQVLDMTPEEHSLWSRFFALEAEELNNKTKATPRASVRSAPSPRPRKR